MKRLLCTFLALAVFGGVARADTIANVDFLSFSNVTDGRYMSVYFQGWSGSETVGTGVYKLSTGSVNGDTQLDSDLGNKSPLYTFCIDINQDVPSGQTYDIVPVADAPDTSGYPNGASMGSARALQVKQLWNHVIGNAPALGSLSGTNNLAAFQLAVWEIVWETDSTLNVASGMGEFYANYADNSGGSDNEKIVNLANDWLSWLSANPDAAAANLVALTNNTNATEFQDYIAYSTGKGSEVPTPSGLIQLLGLLSVIGLIRFRFNRS